MQPAGGRETATDHRVIGPDLGLYGFEDKVGPGLVVWHERGTALRNAIEAVWRDFHYAAGYEFVTTPHVGKQALWEQTEQSVVHEGAIFSGIEVSGVPYLVKPANCPLHAAVYARQPRSYRELPFRVAEFSTIYRQEPSGSLDGLFRVRGVTQDDGHIFCAPDDVFTEIARLLDLQRALLNAFGFHQLELYVGADPAVAGRGDGPLAAAHKILLDAVDELGLDYQLLPRKATYYAARMGVNVIDAHGTRWPLPDLQVDLSFPSELGLAYVEASGRSSRPVMLHRTVIGSLERFVAALLEHHGQRLPAWLAPVHVAVLPVTSEHEAAAAGIVDRLRAEGVRTELWHATNTVGARTRRAIESGVPFRVVVGDRELADGALAATGRQGEPPVEAASADALARVLCERLAPPRSPGRAAP